MKYTSLLFLLFFSTAVFTQDLYDLNTIQTIEVTFAESNWDQHMDQAYAADAGYIMAQQVAINGVMFDSVGVKYKGNSSYSSNQVKNPWHIELNTFKDHSYDGYTDIKLANGAKDPSFIRDVLGYQIARQYMDAPLANYANLYVNGNLIGLYANTESVSKKFANSRFGSKNNTYFDCSPPEGAGPQTTDLPNLAYLGQDSTDYYEAYEMKSDIGWQDLINLCDILANHSDAIEEILDVDRALWMLAFDNAIVNLDSYIGAFAQNYYLYKSDYGKFLPIVWDLNESFGTFSMTGTSNLNNTDSKQRMSHLLHENDSSFPLVQKLLSNPMYKRMYLAHYKTLMLENFDNGTYTDRAMAIQSIIDEAVQADGNKFFGYDDFIDNLNSDIGGGPGPGGNRPTPGITNLMDARNDYILSLSDFTQAEPSISDIALSEDNPLINNTISVTARLTNENAAYLGYRIDKDAPFTKVEMLDDGLHNDGAANDGIYGADITISNAFTQYYIYAENDDIGKFSPQRAEYEYHQILATTTNNAVGDLVINEFLASNDVIIADQDEEFDDWIELYNNSEAAIDLGGYFLTDDAEDLTQWTFPEGTEIAANGYLIIWADDDEEQTGLHANFKISASGESLLLLDPNEDIIDEVTFAEQETDISYGRFPNGTGDFQSMSPTFNAENTNTMTSTFGLNTDLGLRAHPNPTYSAFFLEFEEAFQKEKLVTIYNLNGITLYQNYIAGNSWIDASNWPSGMYIIRVEDSFLKLVRN